MGVRKTEKGLYYKNNTVQQSSYSIQMFYNKDIEKQQSLKSLMFMDGVKMRKE